MDDWAIVFGFTKIELRAMFDNTCYNSTHRHRGFVFNQQPLSMQLPIDVRMRKPARRKWDNNLQLSASICMFVTPSNISQHIQMPYPPQRGSLSLSSRHMPKTRTVLPTKGLFVRPEVLTESPKKPSQKHAKDEAPSATRDNGFLAPAEKPPRKCKRDDVSSANQDDDVSQKPSRKRHKCIFTLPLRLQPGRQA